MSFWGYPYNSAECSACLDPVSISSFNLPTRAFGGFSSDLSSKFSHVFSIAWRSSEQFQLLTVSKIVDLVTQGEIRATSNCRADREQRLVQLDMEVAVLTESDILPSSLLYPCLPKRTLRDLFGLLNRSTLSNREFESCRRICGVRPRKCDFRSK